MGGTLAARYGRLQRLRGGAHPVTYWRLVAETRMRRTTVSSKGQILIPKDIRQKLGWEPGTALELEERGFAVLLRPVPRLRRTRLDELIGCAHYRGPRKSLDEMEAAIRKAARRSR